MKEDLEGEPDKNDHIDDYSSLEDDEPDDEEDHEVEKVPATQQPPQPILDDLVTLDQVAHLAGLSKRSLERYLSDGAIPDPDVRGGGGKANKWYWSNIREPLSKIAQRPLPDRFPGSRFD
jgi:predicted DNA-binding transcriptional regulator AlpA